MKKLQNILSLLALIISLASISVGQNQTNIEGNWLGVIEFSGMKLRLAFKVHRSTDGYTAKFDSIDQAATDLQIDSVTQQGDSVKFDASKLGFTFEGKLNEKGDEINGSFNQGPAAMPVVLRRVTELPTIGRPQDPQKPYPYLEEEVSYKNVTDNVKLAGTLTLPRTGTNHPAVILITGSGGQDRNETIAGHRPFLVLADSLTRKGVAVLRVDDRGVGGSDLGPLTATSESYAGDVLAGIQYLKIRKEINAKQIGLIGHSEGGMIAPLVAARSNDVAFLVLLAGLGQTGADVMYQQTELIHKASGVSPSITAETIAVLKSTIEILKTKPDKKTAEQLIRAGIARQSAEIPDDQKKDFAPIKAMMEAQIPMYVSEWFRFFAAFDPQPTLKTVRIPVLALNGELDLQVPWKENLDLIAAALKAGANKDYTVKAFPKLNHLFQTCQTGLPSEYGKIEETISPQVLQTVSDWILERTINER
ncbi:MAG TPA: alpha/beta hydrolase [Pyrinomonadaceae bacterium]|nr:alpha/beta hydrolase [Pyrinomonadaceae bacterium]